LFVTACSWVVDIGLGYELIKQKAVQEAVLLKNVNNNVFVQTLVSKQFIAARVGIGQRNFDSNRIQIVETKETS
jgi:hypothetical protein